MRGVSEVKDDLGFDDPFIIGITLTLLSFIVFLFVFVFWHFAIAEPAAHDRHVCQDEVFVRYVYEGYERREAWTLAKWECKEL